MRAQQRLSELLRHTFYLCSQHLRPSLLFYQRGWSFFVVFCKNLSKKQRLKKLKFGTFAAYEMIIWLKMEKKK